MSVFTLKVKTKSGQFIINMVPTDTLDQLRQQLSLKVGIPAENIVVLMGYPPKQINPHNWNVTLIDVGIKSGDTLTIEEIKSAHPVTSKQQNTVVNNTEIKTSSIRSHIDEQTISEGLLMRQIVPADNSCLFTSIGFVLGGKVDPTCASFMREIIAEEIKKEHEEYSEAILGRPNAEYRQWIKKTDSWGGAVELAILSKFYGIEIAVVDTVNCVINRFGEDKNYEYRMFLIYDGIHYDPLYKESLEADGPVQTLFPISNEMVLREAEELAKEAKSSKQFTDVNRFTLRCQICRKELTGQQQATEHAVATGHTNFGEIS